MGKQIELFDDTEQLPAGPVPSVPESGVRLVDASKKRCANPRCGKELEPSRAFSKANAEKRKWCSMLCQRKHRIADPYGFAVTIGRIHKDPETKIARTIESQYEQSRRLTLYPAEPVEGFERPKTRAECANSPRPCPWVSCRYHLLLDVRDGKIQWAVPGKTDEERIDAMKETCALDVADEGGAGVERVARALNAEYDAIRLTELRATKRLNDAVRQIQDERSSRAKTAWKPLEEDEYK